jgi:hypothetical protein
MHPDEPLMTIAEVSMAFAGLVGLAGLFGSQARPEVFRVQFFLVIAMVGFALLAGLFAFLPIVVMAMGLSHGVAFRACSLLLAIGLASWTAYGFAQSRKLQRSGTASARGVTQVMISISSLSVVTLFLGALGVLGGRESGFYSAAVFLLLAYSGYFFFMLVWSLAPKS